MNPDVAASVRARLLNQAKQSGEEFERTLVRFAAERPVVGAAPNGGVMTTVPRPAREIDRKGRTVRELLAGRRFSIDYYQREYDTVGAENFAPTRALQAIKTRSLSIHQRASQPSIGASCYRSASAHQEKQAGGLRPGPTRYGPFAAFGPLPGLSRI